MKTIKLETKDDVTAARARIYGGVRVMGSAISRRYRDRLLNAADDLRAGNLINIIEEGDEGYDDE